MSFHQRRKMPKLLRLALITGSVFGGLSLSARSALAVPFASFSDQGSTNSVVFANWPKPPAKGPYTASSSATVTNEKVDFTFEGFANLPPALLSTQDATLNYSVVTTAAASATTVPGVGTLDTQPINQSFTLSFVRTTPFTPAGNPKLHLTNLLTVTLSALPNQSATAQMYGVAGSSSAHLNSDASYATVDFTSDFLKFAGTSDHSMALSYTMQTLEYLGIGAKFLSAYDKNSGGTANSATCPSVVRASTGLCNYHGFSATESGNFGSAPPPVAVFTVPEPASMGVLGIGLFGLVSVRRRRAA